MSTSTLHLYGALARAFYYQRYRRTLRRRVSLFSLGFIIRFWPAEVD